MTLRAGTPTAAALQLTWLDGDIMAWQPGRGAYGGNLNAAVSRALGPAVGSAVGSLRVARLLLPDGPASVMCQRIDPAALVALARSGALDGAPGPSVAWFTAAAQLADHLVREGRIIPVVDDLGDGWHQARWHPLRGDVEAAREAMSASMPAVVVGATRPDDDTAERRGQVAAEVLEAFVDALARLALQYSGWRADLTDTRRSSSRATRQVARALGNHTPRFRPDYDVFDALGEVAAALDQVARRAEGEPVVRARLRLDLPDEIDQPWPLTLELADVADAGRWCTAHDVTTASPLALDLAGAERWMWRLEAALGTARQALSTEAPWLGEWLTDPSAGIDLDQAAATIAAVDELADIGVLLLSPARLTRRRPGTRGTTRTTDAADGAANEPSGQFGRSAIVDWEVVVDGTPIDEATLQRAAESATSLIDVGGRWVQIDRDDARRALENLAEHRRDHTELNAIDLLRLAAELDALDTAGDSLAGQAADDGSDRVLRTTEGWADLLLRGLPDDSLREGFVPDGFTATLRPYQRRGLGWLQFLHRLGLGGCLADDMGLGKTPTTLAHLAGLPGPHLVVCPLSVVRNWQRETARFAPGLRVLVHHGSDRADAASLPVLLADHDLVVTTYQVATRDVEVLRAVSWQCVVLDEAQAVKNPATHTAKAMRRLPAVQHIALTGTPVENRLSELWSILDTVAPGLLGNQQQFRRRFVVPIERHHDPVATTALRQLTSPFLLRRTKADRSLVPDLPDKVEQIAWAPLTREQATMYQAVVDQLLRDAENASGMRRRGLVLAALTRLKQICNHPAHALGDGSRLAGRSGKLARFDELITDLHEAGEQALVFTQFREMGLLLQRHLLERFGQHTPFLHGGVSKAARDRMVDTFQAGGQTESGASPLLLVSLKAGGTGLNLTAASRVVHYDRWWNPAVEDQATDRAWRIGQQQAVFVHKLVCQGTIEERVDTLINDKRALADAVVGTTGETWLSELSTDELRDLVVLDHALRPS